MTYTIDKKRLRTFTTSPSVSELTIYELLNGLGFEMQKGMLLTSPHSHYLMIIAELLDRLAATPSLDPDEQALFVLVLESLTFRGNQPPTDTATLIECWASRQTHIEDVRQIGDFGEIYNQQTERARAARMLLEPWLVFLTAGGERPLPMLCGEHAGYLVLQNNEEIALRLGLSLRKQAMFLSIDLYQKKDSLGKPRTTPYYRLRLTDKTQQLTETNKVQNREHTFNHGQVCSFSQDPPKLTFKPAEGFTFSYRF